LFGETEDGVERRALMRAKTKERLQELYQQASDEKSPYKRSLLIEEIERLLQEEEDGIKRRAG
jgi:hypothetical protein